jgi:hypothetical protein
MIARNLSSFGLVALGCSFGFVACGDNFVVLKGADAGSISQGDGGFGSVVGGISSGGQGPDAGGASSGDLDAGDPDAAPVGTSACEVDAHCSDNDHCTGIETCASGVCQPGTALVCNDGNPCTLDTCAPATGTCAFAVAANGTACADEDRCDGQTCQSGQCVAGLPVTCADDQNECTTHACDPATGVCVFAAVATGVACPDENPCNGTEVCAAGACLPGVQLVCNDNNPCTADVCDPVTGCASTNVPDNTSCADANLCNGIERCSAGVCQPGTAASCDDRNPCTTDTCNPQTGACTLAPLSNGVPCPDGNVCDGQTCVNGACTAGRPVVCASDMDSNPCTANTCVPATGICAPGNLPNGTPCPDGNFCDGTETCMAGACNTPGAPLVCAADNNPCTDDICAPAAGCLYINKTNGTSCADLDLCDGAESCIGGACAPGPPVACSLPQTCNPATGSCQP